MKIISNLQEKYVNINVAKLDLSITVSGTPLEPLITSGQLNTSGEYFKTL